MTRLTPSAKPELRFNGFHGSWTICELGDYLTFKNGINAETEDRRTEPHFFQRSSYQH